MTQSLLFLRDLAIDPVTNIVWARMPGSNQRFPLAPLTNGLAVKKAAVSLGYRQTIEDAFTVLRASDPYGAAVDQWDHAAQIVAGDPAYLAITTAVGADAVAAIMTLAATL